MYLVDNRRYEAGQLELQHALASAYDNRIRPVCLCADPPATFYIARLGTTFVLKRMPLTGSQHAVDCLHYETPAEMSGLGEVLGTAISESPETGITQLRVDFSLSKGVPRAVRSVASEDAGVARSHGACLTLRGLVHYLWREAELTKWRPGFEGKRSWAVVRSHLLTAASSKILKGSPLEDALYVPEPFTVGRAETIRARRAVRFNRTLRRSSQSQVRKMILVGELKEILPARIHFNIVMKHVPDVAFFMSSDLYRTMVRRFEGELALWAGNPECHLIIAATFSLTDWGQPAIDEVCLVLTSAHWIPALDGFEKLLIDRLVRERRTFDKSLTFDSKPPPSSISAVLLDATSAPVPLALDRGLDQHARARSNAVPAEISWQWHVHLSEMPELPR